MVHHIRLPFIIAVLTIMCLGYLQPAWSATISGIEVSGNVRSDEALILAACGLSAGRELSLEDVQDAIKRLYSLGIFSDVRVTVEETAEEKVKLKIVVKEFPILEKITFKGNDKIKVGELKKRIGLAEGQVVSPRAIRNARRSILSFYREKGYLLAEVKARTFQAEGEGRVILNFQIQEGEKVRIKRIYIHGNKTFSDDKVKKQMETKEARWWKKGDFNEETYKKDLTKIIDFYRRHGFRDARVVRDSLYYDRAKRNLFIDITLDEGERYRFGKITWEGNKVFSDEEISQRIMMKEGHFYDQESFDGTLYNLSTLYQEKGYLTTDIVPVETQSGERIDIKLKIEEREPSRVRKVAIVGNTKTKEKVIRRELTLKPGGVFRRSDLARSIRDVYQLNFFKNVEPEVTLLDNGDVDLTIKVEEKSTGQAFMAAGYSQRDKLVGSIGFNIPNLFGNGQSLDLSWDFGKRRETFRLAFSEPWLFGTPTSGSFTLYKTTDRWEDHFDEKRQGGYIRMGKRLTWPDNYSRLYLKYRLEQVEYLNFAEGFSDPYGLKDKEWPETSSSLTLTYLRDSRDMPQFPSRGSMASYSVELAGGPLWGDENYHKQTLESDFYVPVFSKLVFMIKAKLGVVDSFRSGEEVPFSERFMPGGTSLDGVIRGYSERSIGPIEEGVRIGGKMMFVSNLELRIPFAEQQLYGILFTDVGNAWRSASKFRPFGLKRSVGIGVRIAAPMLGIIGFDIGYGFDNEGGKWLTHFQFGPGF